MAQANTLVRVVFIAVAACGLAIAQNSYGTVYGDVGIEAPYVQSLSPPEGPKQGGTVITIQGAGFVDDTRLSCRFARLEPDSETTLIKETAATYVSATEIKCEAPEWDEGACPTCATTHTLTGHIFGHTGSRYLRASDAAVVNQIGIGDYISFAGATVGAAKDRAATLVDGVLVESSDVTANAIDNTLTQYFEVAAIEACSGTGCYCGGGGTWAESTYTVATTYNGTGLPDAGSNTGFEIITPTDTNCALYVYDRITGGARDASYGGNLWRKNRAGNAVDGYTDLACTPVCTGGAFTTGAKITLSEPVYKINGRANVVFDEVTAKRASKFSCTSCKCKGGCQVTVTVTNDGKKYSGSGLGGKVWAGTVAMFSLKDIVPTVHYIDNGLPGYRDSTRIFGPATGGTTITVTGENFQDSPLLRCYFAGVETLVKAEWLSSTKVRCKTPDFFSRQVDLTPGFDDAGNPTTQSNQKGSAKTPHTKVHVTNDGMINVMETEYDAMGHISQNPYINDDGSKGYIGTFDPQNTYTSGMEGFYSNPFRSTCQAGMYPNEGMAPCWDAHTEDVTNPVDCSYNGVGTGGATLDGSTSITTVGTTGSGTSNSGACCGPSCTGVGEYSAGNDVLFKYATCYDANPAGKVDDLDLYASDANTGSKEINSTSTLGQIIKIGTDAEDELQAGPLAYVELHLKKLSSLQQRLSVSVLAGGFSGASTPGTVIAKEIIVVSKIDDATTYAYPVFFTQPPYLLPGIDYYLEIAHVDDDGAAQDTEWKYTAAADTGYYAHIDAKVGGIQFKVKGYTCDGCRTKYLFDPDVTFDYYKFGTWEGVQDTGTTTVDADESNTYTADSSQGVSTNLMVDPVTGANTYRSMLAQEVRPTETGTITHVYLKLKNVEDNSVDQADVSIWFTQYGKYGEYVCSEFGGLLEAGYYGNTLPGSASNEGAAQWTEENPNGGYMGSPQNVCDVNFDGVFDEACGLGTVCDPSNAHNGGCGYRGACTLAETVLHGHRLRPESGASQAPCGDDEDCDLTSTLAPDHMKFVQATDGWVEFEFAIPVPVEKHTTYFINAAVVGNTDYSKEVIWYSGGAYGDGGQNHKLGNSFTAADGAAGGVSDPIEDNQKPTDELRASYTRMTGDWRWEKNYRAVLATKFKRCVSSTAQVMGFVTEGEKTGCCSARASPQGGDKGSMVTITGRNFFPSDDLRCIFRTEDGVAATSTDPGLSCAENPDTCGGVVVNGYVLDSSYTKMVCEAPTLDPHAARDCTNPALCQGTVLVVTNSYPYTIGPQFMGPKWYDATTTAVPAYLGQNPLKFLFSDIFVSPTGSDTVGDGTIARPYQTIQRSVDAANENDQIILLSGYYTGLGNRGLRHHGKKIQVKAYDADRQNTIIDCEHAPDGFILNNNKDSDSPFAGYIDTQDIITKNCENLRIYDI